MRRYNCVFGSLTGKVPVHLGEPKNAVASMFTIMIYSGARVCSFGPDDLVDRSM